MTILVIEHHAEDRKLASLVPSPDVHLVSVTSDAARYRKVAALAAACDAYRLKPINTRELCGQLAAVVEGGGASN